MKILLDESVPRLLKVRLPQLNISTVQEMGWAGIQNGELLRRAEELFVPAVAQLVTVVESLLMTVNQAQLLMFRLLNPVGKFILGYNHKSSLSA